MAVSILERPQGYVIDYDNGDNAIAVDSSGDVVFISPGHGLTDGDIIYMLTPVYSYNGFWKVDVQNASDFKIQDIATNDFVEFKRETGDVSAWYPTMFAHTWSCVHLPITYKLSSTLFPYGNNQGINSFASGTGSNVELTLAAAPLAEFKVLGFCRLVDTSVDGIYEITENDGSTLTIDLPYSASYTLAGGTCYVYYPNYYVNVQIYGGLDITHYFEDRKPYTLLSTIKLIPDNNNEVKFSISRELKKQIQSISNNILGDEMPVNLDGFTMFYITYQEFYEKSTGTEVQDFEGDFVNDHNQFQGFAVNSMLPFKNVYSGFLSDYLIDEESTGAKFLTLFEEPTIFDGYYFDISAIFNYDNVTYFDLPTLLLERIWVTSGGTESTPTYELLDNFDAGLYRLEIDGDCNYSELKIRVCTGGTQTNVNPQFTTDLSSWSQVGGGSDATWQWDSGFGGCAVAHIVGPMTAENTFVIYQSFGIYRRVRIRCEFVVTYFNAFSTTFNVVTYNSGTPVDTLYSQAVSANGTYTVDQTIETEFPYTHIGFWFEGGSAIVPSSPLLVMKYFQIDAVIENLSEQKTLKMACDCLPSQVTDGIYLTWLNYLGGYDYWLFTAHKDHQVDIKENTVRNINLFTDWPKSYGESASTVRQETKRTSCIKQRVRSQPVSLSNLEAMKYIKTSPLVQIMVSINDIRTVLVDTESFTVYNEGQHEYAIEFTIEYTDYIPSQSL